MAAFAKTASTDSTRRCDAQGNSGCREFPPGVLCVRAAGLAKGSMDPFTTSSQSAKDNGPRLTQLRDPWLQGGGPPVVLWDAAVGFAKG